MCKSVISEDKLIPLYGRAGNQTDKCKPQVPPRPASQRTKLFGNVASFFRLNIVSMQPGFAILNGRRANQTGSREHQAPPRPAGQRSESVGNVNESHLFI